MLSSNRFIVSPRHLMALAAIFLCVTATARAVESQPGLKAFAQGDSLEEIREKIQYNGYSFKVKDYGRTLPLGRFVPGRHSSSDPAYETGRRLTLPAGRLADVLPTSFDWRDVDGKAYIGDVRDQGNLGSCYSFGACAAAESTYNYANGLYDDDCVNLSESYIAWSLGSISPYSDHFSGGDGADYDYYELLALTIPGSGTGYEGVCLESAFPYTETQPTSQEIAESWTYPRITFNDWGRVYPDAYADTTDAIKLAIMTYGAVDAAVYVGSAFESYSSGVYEDTNVTADADPYYYMTTNHAISLVGWDDEPAEGGGGCWILRNSWGDNWGESGYMRIRYFSAGVNCAACYLVYGTTPLLITGDVDVLTSQTVTLEGYVDPHGSSASVYFEYGATDAYGSSTPLQTVSGSYYTEVEAEISGLTLGNEYHYRVAASGDSTVTPGEDKSFELTAPELSGQPEVASGISSTAVSASVDTHNVATDVWFEYGMSGGTETLTTDVQSVNGDEVSFEADLSGLQSDAYYWVRAVAENPLGVVRSGSSGFTTESAIFYEDFEDGVGEWTQEYLTGELAWVSYTDSLMSGDGLCAMLYPSSNGQWITRLISPAFAVEGKTVSISFTHLQAAYLTYQDTLTVYYRQAPTGDWTQLPGASFPDEIASPISSSFEVYLDGQACQLAFEGEVTYGWGVFIDDVLVKSSSTINAAGEWMFYQ